MSGYQYRGKLKGDLDPWAQEPKSVPANEQRKLQPCGTYAAYRRHKNHCEEPCDACVEAKAAHLAERRGGRRRRGKVVRCGTYAGYVKHYKRGEKPCGACKAEQVAYQRGYRHKVKRAA